MTNENEWCKSNFLLCRYLIRTNLVQQVGCTAVCSPYILFIESNDNIKLERCLLFSSHMYMIALSHGCVERQRVSLSY